MADIAYMIREDWADNATGMARNSERIREWLGSDRYALVVQDVTKYSPRDFTRETADYIGAVNQRVGPVSIGDLDRTWRSERPLITAIVIHPRVSDDLEVLRSAVEKGTIGRLFVMVCSPTDVVRIWLESQGAVDLMSGATWPAPDSAMVEAALMMVNEEYDGLSSGHGKDIVIGLLRDFRIAGYPSDEGTWARAFLAAGGTFRGLDSVRRFAVEVEQGRNHRVTIRHRHGIVDMLEQRAEQRNS